MVATVIRSEAGTEPSLPSAAAETKNGSATDPAARLISLLREILVSIVLLFQCRFHICEELNASSVFFAQTLLVRRKPKGSLALPAAWQRSRAAWTVRADAPTLHASQVTGDARPRNDQTNSVLPGWAMGRMGKSMSQVRLSGTSFSWEFIAWSQVICFPV